MPNRIRRTRRVYADVFSSMPDIIPAGEAGDARVEHFTVSEKDASFHNAMNAFVPGGRFHQIAPDDYARLFVNGQLVMSDTDLERWTNIDAVEAATGDVLIGGLGLGLIVIPILKKADVRSVKVIERSAGVIALVAPRLHRLKTAKKLVIEAGDINTWSPVRPGRQFDYIYLDIWPNTCVDDYEHHKQLRRRYRRYLKPSGTVDSWRFHHLQELKRSGRWR